MEMFNLLITNAQDTEMSGQGPHFIRQWSLLSSSVLTVHPERQRLTDRRRDTERERGRETETDRDTEIETERSRETEGERQRQRERQTQRALLMEVQILRLGSFLHKEAEVKKVSNFMHSFFKISQR